jgi:hypothetical protein
MSHLGIHMNMNIHININVNMNMNVNINMNMNIHIDINVNMNMKINFNNRKIVGIFVRRGDFISLDNTQYGKWLVPLEYYHSSIKKFRDDDQYKNCEFIVFSEDVDWCKQNFPGFEVYNSEFDIVSFYILSKVDGWILANSSFSWWAEFIGNPHKNKKVIAPYPWIKDHNYNIEIYRDHWERIEW